MSKHDETTKSEQMEKIKLRVACSLAEEMLNYFKEVFEGWAEDKCNKQANFSTDKKRI